MPYKDLEKRRAASRDWVLKRSQSRREDGLCPSCGKRPPLPDKSKCDRCLGVHRDSQRRLAKVIVVPPPGMITLDEAAIRAGVTRGNFDYHRRQGHVVGAEVRSHGPNGEKRSYIAEGFKLTIPKPQKRTLPAIEGRPDLIPFGTAARKIGMEPKTFKRRVARGLIRGETQTLEASGGTWHFIHRDFEVVEPPPRLPPLPPPKPRGRVHGSRVVDGRVVPRDAAPTAPRLRMPAEQQPRFPNMATCAICGRRRVPRDRERAQMLAQGNPDLWPRCRTCQSRIELHVAGIRAAALARGHAYDNGLANEYLPSAK